LELITSIYVAPEIPLITMPGANQHQRQTFGGAIGNFVNNWFGIRGQQRDPKGSGLTA